MVFSASDSGQSAALPQEEGSSASLLKHAVCWQDSVVSAFAEFGNSLKLLLGQAASLSIVLLNVSMTPSENEFVSRTKRILKDRARI